MHPINNQNGQNFTSNQQQGLPPNVHVFNAAQHQAAHGQAPQQAGHQHTQHAHAPQLEQMHNPQAHTQAVQSPQTEKQEPGFLSNLWSGLKTFVTSMPIIGPAITSIRKLITGGDHITILGKDGLPVSNAPSENIKPMNSEDFKYVNPGAIVLIDAKNENGESIKDDNEQACLQTAEIVIPRVEDRAKFEIYSQRQFKEPVGIRTNGDIFFVEREELKSPAPLALSLGEKQIIVDGAAMRFLTDTEKTQKDIFVIKANEDKSFTPSKVVSAGKHRIKNFGDKHSEVQDLNPGDNRTEFVLKNDLRILNLDHPSVLPELKNAIEKTMAPPVQTVPQVSAQVPAASVPKQESPAKKVEAQDQKAKTEPKTPDTQKQSNTDSKKPESENKEAQESPANNPFENTGLEDLLKPEDLDKIKNALENILGDINNN